MGAEIYDRLAQRGERAEEQWVAVEGKCGDLRHSLKLFKSSKSDSEVAITS